jgi:tetratricopeptide (TPR) repeat protein
MRKKYYALICVVVAILLLVGCSESKKYYKQAEAFRELEKYDEAIVAYQKAIEADPNYASAHYGLGLSYEQLNKFEEAIKQYQKTLELNPVDSNARRQLLRVEGKQAFNNQDYKEAINKFKAIEAASLSTDEIFMLGKAYYEESTYDKAVSLLQIAVQKVPNNEEYRYSYAHALYANGNYEDAEREFEASSGFSNSKDYKQRSSTLACFERGKKYYNEEDYPDAEFWFKAAERENKTSGAIDSTELSKWIAKVEKALAQLPIVTLRPYKGLSVLFWWQPGGGAVEFNTVRGSVESVNRAYVLTTTLFTVPGTTRTYRWYYVKCIGREKEGWVMDTYVR